MNVRDLEYFISVAECGSFSRASVQLGRPQPVLSRHIRELETELRVPLLYRNGRGVVMTQAGERLKQLGATIIRQIQDAQNQIRHLSPDYLDSAAIGMPASVSAILLPPLARALRNAHADAELRFLDGCNGDLLNSLNAGSLNVALLYDAPGIAHPNLEAVLSQPLYLIEACPADPEAPDIGATIEAAELAGIPLVLPGKRHGLRQIVASWANRNALDLTVQCECDSYSSMLQVVSSGMAATLLPAASLKREILSGYFRCRLITKPALYRTIALAASQSRPVNAGLVTQIKKMIETVRDDFLWPQLPGNTQPNIRAIPASSLNGALKAAEEIVL
ncbi:LysR family transcriptional regulator [Gluconobacter oxydans]|uniref:LysR family transcriptional regulator n=1 Tax=Gluconobacter oxydans TaxID=442 RepID=UPI0039E850A1